MRILPFSLLMILLAGSVAAQKPGKEKSKGKGNAPATVAFYNLENLFDTINDPAINDEEFLPMGKNQWNTHRYQVKLSNMAKVISELGDADGPEILGLAEVENEKVIRDLAKQPALASRKYEVVHFDSPDERGIDVALMYKKELFSVASEAAFTVKFNESDDKTRDILYACLTNRNRDSMHILVNHWPSRRGGQAESEKARFAAAEVAKHICDSLLMRNPKAKIILMGDLNDNPDDKSVEKILGAVSSPEGFNFLFNPMAELHKKGTGTLTYKGKWDLFDQIMISPGLTTVKGYRYKIQSAAVYHPEWMGLDEGKTQGAPKRTFVGEKWYEDGYSDHFPVYITLEVVNR